MASLDSMQELEDELLFQQTLLNTLDEDEDDGDHQSDQRRQDIAATIADLEQRMARLSGPAAGASQESGHDNYHFPGAYPQHAQALSQLDGLDEFPNLTLPSLKRPRAQSTLSLEEDALPSKRSTPNPPGASLMGPPPTRQAAWIERQRQIEEAARHRRQSEAQDAAFATRLSQQPPSSPVAGPSRNNHASAANVSPSQMAPIFRPQSYRSNSHVQPPNATPSASHVKPELYSTPSYSTPQHVKPENGAFHPHSAPPRRSGSTVIDLTGSDDDNDVDLTTSQWRQQPLYPNPTSNGPVDQMADAYRRRLWQQHNAQPQTPPATFVPAAGSPYQRQLEWQRRRFEEDRIRRMEEDRTRRLLEYQMSQRVVQQQHLQAPSRYSQPSSSQSPNHHNPARPMPNTLGPYLSSAVQRAHHDDFRELSNLLHGRGRNYSPESDDDPLYLSTHPRRIDDLRGGDFQDPEQTKEELRKLVENIQPDDMNLLGSEEDVPVEGLNIKLKPYQKSGLEWLQKMEDGSNKGGILADDMGLGKTVQAISLIVTRRSEDPVNRTTLILAPVALLRQWEQEIMTKVKPGRHRLQVFVHHSGTKKKSHHDLRQFDVVLTTFGTIAAELKKMDKYEQRRRDDPNARPRDDEKCLFISNECNWYRVIVDEAQCIKNRTTKTARAAYCIQARSRFCMTGTPMMNSVEELFSLIQFLRIKPYNNWNKFRTDFVQPLKNSEERVREGAMQKLQALLRAVLLRRNKQTKINGRPILNLPERSVEEINPTFSDDERQFYLGVENKTAVTFNKYLKAGTVGRSYAHILVLLLRLRQACCHPHLIKDFGVVAATADISQDTMDDTCKNLDENVVKRIKEQDGNFECPVCYDAVENPAIFAACGHFTCPDCYTRIADPSHAVAEGDEGRSAKCPQCRGLIQIKQVLDFECFKRIHLPEEVAPTDDPTLEDGENGDSMDTDEDSDEEESDDESDTSSLDGFIVKDDVGGDENVVDDDEVAKEEEDEDAAERNLKAALKAKSKKKGKGKSKKSKGKGKGKLGSNENKKKAANMSIPELKKLAARSTSWRKRYLRMIKKGFISSAKIEKTMEILRPIIDSPEGEKIIIFSQWTSLLDLLEVPVSDAGWGYRRYDGSMNAKLRADAVDDFKNRPNVRMMLVSLKAGNAGLNLSCASQVIILDPFWNPYIEEQAIDRAHRLGQTRPVKVHRVLIQETVEDRIVALQEKKRALISEALDEKASQSLGRLSMQELAYLFGINRNMNDPVRVPGRGR